MLNNYRLRQFWYALTAVPTQTDIDLINKYLTPSLMTLFNKMQTSEKAHSIMVFKDLLQANENNRDLLIAALLHDVGKSIYPLSLFERVEIVIGTALFPHQTLKWGTGKPKGWKRPFVVAAKHSEWGAQLAADAGASEKTVEIIRDHHKKITRQTANSKTKPSIEQLIILLKRFDNQR